MISKSRVGIAVVGLMLAVAGTAQAQWRATAIGVAEVDTESTLLLLAGLSASPTGMKVSPIIGVQGYHLGFDGATARTNVFTVKPYVGLSNGYGSGSVYGTVGYAFSSRNDVVIRSTSTNDIGEGVVVAGGWDHWGSGTPWGHQLLGSYNFDSENFWGRGRVTRQIAMSGQSQRRLGAELAFSSGDNYQAWQPGAILELHNGRGGILGLGAGAKIVDGGDNAIYFKVEGVVPVKR